MNTKKGFLIFPMFLCPMPEDEGKYLKEHHLISYEDFDIHNRIRFKGLISGDKAAREEYQKTTDWDFFSILYLIKKISNWKTAINCLLYKMQVIDKS
jgi:hypothetical protein